jgi:phosphatidylserine/phosphatidylglycerophosphate/cardiolipin synthase-like enzyme
MLIPLSRLEDIQSSKDDLENLAQLVRDMVNAMEKQLSLFLTQDQKQSIDTSLAMFKKGEVVTQMTKKVAPAISWNHAKMLAVHGQTLLTGGGNYWSEYVDGARDISDLQCKIKGNATFSAHLYCDHLWK